MPLNDEGGDAANENRTPCASCANAAECEVWGTPVCYPCASDWRDESPTYGDIAAKYGPNADNAAVYQAFTANWMKTRKRGAA